MKAANALTLALLVTLACGGNGLFAKHILIHRSDLGRALCPAIPLPAASTSELLSKLQPFLDEAAKNISAALEADKSPGGVAINVVYNDTVLWSKGFGVVNESGRV